MASVSNLPVFRQQITFEKLSNVDVLGNIFTFVSICMSFYIFHYLVIRHLFSPFRRLPSPKQGFLWFRLLHEPKATEIEKWIDELPHKGLIRYHGLFNRERIFIASPEAAKDFLGIEAYKFIKPELQWILAHNIAGHGLLIQEGDAHKQSRKRFNPTFSSTQMRKWSPQLWRDTIDTINTIPQMTRQTTPKDIEAQNGPLNGVVGLLKIVAAGSIDMIGHFAYKVDLNTLKQIGPRNSRPSVSLKDPKTRFGRAYIEMFKTTKRGQLTLRAASVIGPKIALKLPIRAVKTISGIMRLVYDTAEDIVRTHNSTDTQCHEKENIREDMLSMIMKTGHFSHQDLVEQTVHFLAAGTETVVGSVCWAIHLLSRRPEMQALLRQEIRESIPSPCSEQTASVTNSHFHGLKYLNAIVEEVLRFHSINTLLWRECIERATIAGFHIPKGTTIVFSPWTLNRDPAHWGPDARSFKPERWLDNPSGGADHPYSFLTFGGGPRRCVGEQYARDELLCLVGALIGRYEFTPIAPEEGSDEGYEIGDNFALTLFKICEGWELNIKEIPGW